MQQFVEHRSFNDQKITRLVRKAYDHQVMYENGRRI